MNGDTNGGAVSCIAVNEQCCTTVVSDYALTALPNL